MQYKQFGLHEAAGESIILHLESTHTTLKPSIMLHSHVGHVMLNLWTIGQLHQITLVFY